MVAPLFRPPATASSNSCGGDSQALSEAAAVVIALYKIFDIRTLMIAIAIVAGIDLFVLECFTKLSQLPLSYGFAGRLMLGSI